MVKYLIQRLVFLIPVFFGITLITFCVTQLAPGDPVDRYTEMNPKVSQEAKQKLQELYGLDQPVHIRYFHWLSSLVRLDFGRSFKDGEKVIVKIARRIPVTLTINLLSIFLILVIAIPLGVWGAVKEGTWIDHGIALCVFVGFSMPSFWLALLLMSAFGVHLHVLPVSGLTSLDFEYLSPLGKVLDVARHLVLPVTVSALAGFAGMSRFMRNGMLEVLRQEYIKTAWSKGLSPAEVYYKHAFGNAILPIVTILGLSVPALLGGSVIFETIFSIPGMGKLMFDAVMSRDMNVYMAILTVGAVLTLLGNLLADLAYRRVDPRIRYE